MIFISSFSLYVLGQEPGLPKKDITKEKNTKEDIQKKKINIPLDRQDKEVTLFKAEKEETLFELGKEQIKKFIKNFDHRKEDEISLLWLKFPLEILAILFQTAILFGALLSFISAKREEKEKNFFKEKDTFRKLWHSIYTVKKDIMKFKIDHLPHELSDKQRLYLKADVVQLLDLLDDIYQHEKTFFNYAWRSWERDFERAFATPLIQTVFLTSKDYHFDDGFKKYALKLIKKFSDVETLEEEYTETIQEAEEDIAKKIQELNKDEEN